MKCPRCQHESDAGAKFCEECAAPLAWACAKCRRPLSPTAKFCPECAHPAGSSAAPAPAQRFDSPESYTPKHLAEKILTSKTALEGERKQVTVLFADLKGSLELLADRDPEEARKLLDPVLERMMDAVHRYEGTVNQVMGDGIMALFGAPLAHEDHAVRACYAAHDMQAAMRRYTEDVRHAHGIEVQIRVGLNSGEVVVRAIGSDLRMDYTAVGQTTHLAARMEQLAPPGTIRLTADTLRLAEGYIEVKPLGPVPVKGLEAPVDVYEMLGAGLLRSRLQVAAARGLTRFVGRETEVEQLRQALGRAAAGHGQLVALVGEPGVGKSRLVWEVIHSHRTHGWLTVQARSVSYGKATPYLPVIDLLKSYLKIQDQDDPRAVREKVTGKLLTLDEALKPTVPACLALLDVPVDDAAWSALDPPQRRQQTLDAVKRLLLRESQVQPLLVVFEDLHWVDGETQAFLDRLVESLPAARMLLLVNYRPEYTHRWGSKTYYTQLRLDPLPPESAEALLDALLGSDPPLRPLKHLLIARTEGNPFFLEESVRTLVETKVLAGERGAYRLARALPSIQVPATVQAVLAARIDRLAAEEKRLLQAAAVIGKDVPFAVLQAIAEVPEDVLRHSLATLQAGEFLHEARFFPDLDYTFKHALTHEVAYGSLLHDRRRVLHARIMEAIERLAAGRTAEHAASLARHALRGERWDEALAYSRQAAARALAQSAYREAIGCLEQALEALRHVAPGPERIGQAIDVRLELRNALFGVGDHGRTIDHVEEAVDLARRADDRPRLGRATALQALSLWASGQHARATVSARQAEAIAAELGDDTTRVIAEFYLGVTHYAVGEYRLSVSHLARNVAFLGGERANERFGLMGPPAIFCRTFLAWSLAELGELEQACARGLEAVDMADRLGEPYPQQVALMGMAWSYLRRGDPARALPALERAIDLSERWALPTWLPTLASEIGNACVLSGRPAEALPMLERGVREAMRMSMRANLPLILTRLGEGLLSLGQAPEARVRAEEALGLATELGERGHEAWALRLLGEIEAAAGQDEVRAAAHYGDALALAGSLEMRPLVARCHLGLGKLYRRIGERTKGDEHLATAITMYREMDMGFWLEKAEAALGSPPRNSL